jgi:hypothetical protein
VAALKFFLGSDGTEKDENDSDSDSDVEVNCFHTCIVRILFKRNCALLGSIIAMKAIDRNIFLLFSMKCCLCNQVLLVIILGLS